MRWVAALLILAACSGAGNSKRATLEYKARCPLRIEEGKEFYKVPPMIEESGKIEVYNDSILFSSGDSSYVVHILSFSGRDDMSHIIGRKEDGQAVVFLLQRNADLGYEACILTGDGGQYFDIKSVQ